MTWLNAMNDQGMGRGAKVVTGTVRDSLHMVDVIFGLDGGELPDIVVSDTGSYCDLVFGILELLGISYRPALADLPDQKGWRIDPHADYGPLNTFARGKIDLARIRAHWPDMLRVIASIYTGAVRAYDVVTMLQRDGHPTALGEAIAAYGRIFKTLHILAYIDADETYRRDIKHIRNLQEGRHALARKICHGKKGELYHRYERGPGKPARRPRPGPQLRRAVDHRLPRRRRRPSSRPRATRCSRRTSPGSARSCASTWACTAPTPSPCPTWRRAPSASCATPTPPMRKKTRPVGRA